MELGRPFTYSLELVSEDDSIKASSLLGNPDGITVKLALQDNSERFIHGIVTSFSCTGRIGGYTTYRAQLRPWLSLLEYSRTSDRGAALPRSPTRSPM